MNEFNWQIKNKAKNNNSRTGVISTPHGQIETPAFIFCATKATLKSINTYQAKENLTQIISLYHLPYYILYPSVYPEYKISHSLNIYIYPYLLIS